MSIVGPLGPCSVQNCDRRGVMLLDGRGRDFVLCLGCAEMIADIVRPTPESKSISEWTIEEWRKGRLVCQSGKPLIPTITRPPLRTEAVEMDGYHSKENGSHEQRGGSWWEVVGWSVDGLRSRTTVTYREIPEDVVKARGWGGARGARAREEREES